jgi:hypothetical protein
VHQHGYPRRKLATDHCRAAKKVLAVIQGVIEMQSERLEARIGEWRAVAKVKSLAARWWPACGQTGDRGADGSRS